MDLPPPSNNHAIKHGRVRKKCKKKLKMESDVFLLYHNFFWWSIIWLSALIYGGFFGKKVNFKKSCAFSENYDTWYTLQISRPTLMSSHILSHVQTVRSFATYPCSVSHWQSKRYLDHLNTM